MSERPTAEKDAPHVVTIKHDAESHEYDCHDDCTATLTCPGVTDSCRCWWECTACWDARKGLDADALDEYDDRLSEEGEAHGVEHQHIDGMWMTPTDRCLTSSLDTDADELVDALPDGDHLVDLDCQDGFVYVTAIKPTRDLPPAKS